MNLYNRINHKTVHPMIVDLVDVAVNQFNFIELMSKIFDMSKMDSNLILKLHYIVDEDFGLVGPDTLKKFSGVFLKMHRIDVSVKVVMSKESFVVKPHIKKRLDALRTNEDGSFATNTELSVMFAKCHDFIMEFDALQLAQFAYNDIDASQIALIGAGAYDDKF